MKWFAIFLLVKTVFSSSPEENQGSNNPKLYEGDMLFSAQQRYNAEHGVDVDSDRKRGSIKGGRLWPNGVVLYAIDPALARNSRAMAAINAGMNEWITKTCIRFKRRTRETAHVYFQPGSGCSSFVGRTGSRQPINLGSGCWKRGIVAHEIGHAIGFYHEQSRPDRDTYVDIKLENVIKGFENNFNKYPRSTIDSLGTPYDYGSVMHYGDKYFTKNGKPTIVVRPQGGFKASIGQRSGLSRIDAEQANKLYRSLCQGVPTPKPTPAQSGCSNYQLLTESDREKGSRLSRFGRAKCDRSLKKAWYRFSGAAGKQMPTKVVPTSRCGTRAPGWLRGGHPTVLQGAVSRTVCFNWSRNQCRWSRVIRVQNCGAFFVYELTPTRFCNLRYCGDNNIAPNRPPTAVCRDRYSFCRSLKRLCNRFSWVRNSCKRTCNTC